MKSSNRGAPENEFLEHLLLSGESDLKIHGKNMTIFLYEKY
jgi:hypothetical protein